jgi:hypothetical protein
MHTVCSHENSSHWSAPAQPFWARCAAPPRVRPPLAAGPLLPLILPPAALHHHQQQQRQQHQAAQQASSWRSAAPGAAAGIAPSLAAPESTPRAAARATAAASSPICIDVGASPSPASGTEAAAGRAPSSSNNVSGPGQQSGAGLGSAVPLQYVRTTHAGYMLLCQVHTWAFKHADA